MRILIVEDERPLAEAVLHILRKAGFSADAAYDGEEGEALAESGIYDLIVLDRMLPCKDGVSICKSLRARGVQTPILFLTARDAVCDRVEGLDAGGDDYLVKPFASAELLARIHALLRRPEAVRPAEECRLGRLVLRTGECAAEIDGETVTLTAQEAQLLEMLMRNRGQTLSKSQILDKVWGFDKSGTDGNVELYIHYLRRKIDFTRAGTVLQTVRGAGYCLKEQ
jgi:DNA-binding response OmpR family regulator